MRYSDLTRREIIDLFHDESAAFLKLHPCRKLEPHPSKEARLFWRASPKRRFEPPVAIVVNDDRYYDFIAWAGTYLGGMRPLTAICRVLSSSEAILTWKLAKHPSLGRAQNACVGLILGEFHMLTGLRSRHFADRHDVYKATHAFAIARSIALYGSHAPLTIVGDAWKFIRSNTDAASYADDVLRAPWSAIASVLPEGLELLGSVHPDVATACKEVRSSGDISETTWRQLASSFPSVYLDRGLAAGSRENRVLFAEEVLRSLPVGKKHFLADFVGGYVLSRIDPGSFDHAHLVTDPRALATLPWYGVLAGLHPRFSLASSSSVKHLLGRDLSRAVALDDYPDCDIGATELPVAIKHWLRRGVFPSHTQVEIIPGLNLIVHHRPHQSDDSVRETRDSSSELSQRKLFDNTGEEKRSHSKPRRKPR